MFSWLLGGDWVETSWMFISRGANLDGERVFGSFLSESWKDKRGELKVGRGRWRWR